MGGIVPDPDRRLRGADELTWAAALLVLVGVLGAIADLVVIVLSALGSGASLESSTPNPPVLLGAGPVVVSVVVVLLGVTALACGVIGAVRGRPLGLLWALLALVPGIFGLAVLTTALNP